MLRTAYWIGYKSPNAQDECTSNECAYSPLIYTSEARLVGDSRVLASLPESVPKTSNRQILIGKLVQLSTLVKLAESRLGLP